ncbi:MAG TPA: DinB family protein [Bacteroidia bacterium]|nr:DinB family protein [Bacteroidia bacterium]HNT81145.1 DinB family protein [Bacteroidia bacterium]
MNSLNADLIIQEFKVRVFDESMQRILTCIDLLHENQLHLKIHENGNSVGNLVLHLCGNARQWIVASFGFEKDIRVRQEEFDAKGPFRKEDLKKRLMTLKNDLQKCLDQIDVSVLIKNYRIQSFEVSGLSALIHVIEHFSYHTGQITLICKYLSGKETGYYSGIKLD